MTTTSLFPYPVFTALNQTTSLPLAGGKLYSYIAGTATPLVTYTDETGGSANTNPVILNAAGQANVWLGTSAYKLVLQDANGVQQWSVDNIVNANANLTAALASLSVGQGVDLVGGSNRIVTSIANLRTCLKTGNGEVFVTGYYSQGDGGGGNYWYNSADTSSSDNGGTIIVASDGGRWYLTNISSGISVKQFGAKGDGTTDDTLACQSALNNSLIVRFPTGTYKLTSVLTGTIQHQITGDGIGNTNFNPSFTTTPAIAISAPVSDTKASLKLSNFTINSKFGITIGGTRSSQPTDGAIIGGTISNIQIIGTYSSSSGDPAYNTDQLRDVSDNLESSYNGSTTFSALNTFTDISSYGIGIQITKGFDILIESPQFYGCGVSLALLGSDLIKWRGGRSHEVGIHFYTERIGTYGSQCQIDDSPDILHNRRAGGFIFNQTKFDRIYDAYYEDYSNAALLAYAEFTEGLIIEHIRIDDTYYTGGGGTASGTTPILLFSRPFANNQFLYPQYQKFSSFSTPIPGVRVVGSLSANDTNHPEQICIVPGNGYCPIRYTSVNPGCRYGLLDYTKYNPNNMPAQLQGSGYTPLTVVDGIINVFYNSASLTASAIFYIDQLQTTYTLSVNCKVSTGTTLTMPVAHYRQDGSLVETLNTSAFGGYNTSSYTFQSVSVALSQPPANGDYLIATWTTSTAKIAEIQIK